MPAAPATADTQPTMCLLHGDFHLMGQACWSATMHWYFDHTPHLDAQEARDAYLGAVERKMLDQLMEALR